MTEEHGEAKDVTRQTLVNPSSMSSRKYCIPKPRDVSYTPQKLENRHSGKQTGSKRVEVQNNKVRELESLNTLLEDKGKHLTKENETIAKSYDLQIQMYKKTIKDQEAEAKRLIKNIQMEYSIEIKNILQGHQEDSKVVQAEREELESRIAELLTKVNHLQQELIQRDNTIKDVRSQLNLNSQKLVSTQDNIGKAQVDAKNIEDKHTKEIGNLNDLILKQATVFKQQSDSAHKVKTKEVEDLRKTHAIELDKQQSRHTKQMNSKCIQMKEIISSFQMQGKRLQEIVKSKEKAYQSLLSQGKRQREKSSALVRSYDLEIHQLVSEKGHILDDLAQATQEKIQIQKQFMELSLLYQAPKEMKGRIFRGFEGNIGRSNPTIIVQTKRLCKLVEKLEMQTSLGNESQVKGSDSASKKLTEQNKGGQVRNLKEVLLESTLQIQRCRKQMMHMESERQHLLRANLQCEQEAIRLKGIISEQEIQFRIRRF